MKSFESFTKEELKSIPELSSSFQLEPGAVTDIDLLVWLTNFEHSLTGRDVALKVRKFCIFYYLCEEIS